MSKGRAANHLLHLISPACSSFPLHPCKAFVHPSISPSFEPVSFRRCHLWPASFFLADVLLSSPHLVAGRSILELGSGCGLTGLCVSLLPPHTGASRVSLAEGARTVTGFLSCNVRVFCRRNLLPSCCLLHLAPKPPPLIAVCRLCYRMGTTRRLPILCEI